MVTMTVNVEFDKTALINALNIDAPAKRVVERVCEIAKDESIKDYKKKRKSTNPTSLIINSFVIKSPVKTSTGYIGYVYAETPYLVWVHEGHRLRNNKQWPGYHFMAVGAFLAVEQTPTIINEEFSSVFKKG